MGALTLATLVCLLAQTDDARSGRVVDRRTGAGIAGAQVAVVRMVGAVRTDAEGRFTLPEPPRLPADVVVVLPDGTVAGPVRFRERGPMTIHVEPSLHESVAVLGVATLIDTASAAAAARLTAADLALRHPSTLVQMLENVPGAGSAGEGQGAAPVLRGLGRSRTLVLVDGARATTERRIGPNAWFADPALVQIVDVARGPAGVAYGSDAMGGVIALEMRGPAARRGVTSRVSGAAGAGVPERAGDADVSLRFDGGALLAGVRAREVGDYDAPAGTIANSAWRDRGAFAAWEQTFAGGRLNARWQSDFGRDLGRPRSDSHLMLVTSPVDDSHRVTAAWQRPAAGFLRHVRIESLFASTSQQVDQDRLPTTGPARPRSLESSESSYRDIQLRGVADRTLRGVRFQAGIETQGRYGLETTDTVTSFNLAGAAIGTATTNSLEGASRTGVGIFAEGRLAVAPRLHAAIGGRVDTLRSRTAGGFWGERSISSRGSAGAASLTALPIGGLTITAQLARGFREPTLTERFYRGPVGRGIVEGNPDLTAETSVQMDVTARLSAGRVRAEVSAYDYRVNDLIERYSVNQNLFRHRNRVDARFRGIEGMALFTFRGGLALEAAAQVSRGRDGADDTPLDDVAPAFGSLAARWTGGRAGSYLRVAAYGAHDAAGPSEVPTPAYRLADAGVSWRVLPQVTVNATVRNLFDAAYYATAGPRWVYAPGRTLAVRMSALF